MGNWHIAIQGIGCHHNVDHPRDAEKMAAVFVNHLRAAGHEIESATFTSGSKEDLKTIADQSPRPTAPPGT